MIIRVHENPGPDSGGGQKAGCESGQDSARLDCFSITAIILPSNFHQPAFGNVFLRFLHWCVNILYLSGGKEDVYTFLALPSTPLICLLTPTMLLSFKFSAFFAFVSKNIVGYG